MTVYTAEEADIVLPKLDLLTFLFESKWCHAAEQTEIHIEAANPRNSITKAAARNLIQRIAHELRTRYAIGSSSGPSGTGARDTVLLISAGNPFVPILFYSVVCAGGLFSAASTAFTPNEYERQMRDCGAKVVICEADLLEKVLEASKQSAISLKNVLVMDWKVPGNWNLTPVEGGASNGRSAFPDNNGTLLPWTRITDKKTLKETPICVLYSSGTTGLPKGVLLSHLNCVSANTCWMAKGAKFMQQYQKTHGRPFECRTLAHLPMAHIAGVEVFSINPFYLGGTAYWVPKYVFSDFLKYSKQFRTTYQFSVPPIWLQIAKSDAVTDHFNTLEVAMSGAAPMGLDLVREVSTKLGRGEVFLGQCYGTTETTGNIAALRWDDKDESGSVGEILANVKVRLVDDNDKDVPPGTPGEILVCGPIVSQGYSNNASATRASFTSSKGGNEDGGEDIWYHTGDVGVVRNDLVYIVDRKKELIKYKGLQVAPAELEALLVSHPKIADAAVIGVDSEKWQTEVPMAFVVSRSTQSMAEDAKEQERAEGVLAEEIAAFVRENLAQHKQLRGGVVFVDEIPKSPSGKILRKDLRARAVELARSEVIKPRL